MKVALSSSSGPSPGVLVVQGDSGPGGTGIANPTVNAWPYVMARLLQAQGFRFTLYVASHPGEYTADMLTREAVDVTARYSDSGRLLFGHRASCVFLEHAGSNDLATGIDEPTTVRTNMNSWNTAAVAPGPGIITGQTGLLSRTSQFSGGMSASSFATKRAANVAYCATQVGTRWAFAGNPSVRPELADAADTGFFLDGVHLTIAGHAIYGEYLAGLVRTAVLAT